MAYLVIIELEDLTNIEKHKSRLKDWAHYYTVYSYLAYSFNKKVDLIPNEDFKNNYSNSFLNC